MPTHTKEKKFAALLSIVSNTTLIVMKFIAGFVSGSISIISEAIHSMSDLLASILAFFSVSKSAIPADEDHQYGHGKYEDFSGLIEGFLIIMASFYIIFEAAKKLLFGLKVEINTDLAMGVMLFSVITNIFVSFYLFKVAKKTDSIALFADAEHLRTDVYSSLAVFLGILAIKITDIHILDPLVALIVAVLIMSAGYHICKKSANNLLDGTLPAEENTLIKNILNNYADEKSIKYQNLKTRKSGMMRQIELTILIEANTTVKEGHKLCDEIEHRIDEKLGNVVFLIHLEPMEQTDCIK